MSKKELAAMTALVSVIVSTFLALIVPSQEDVGVEAGREIVQEIETQVRNTRWQPIFGLVYLALVLVVVALLLAALLPVAKALSGFLNSECLE